MSEVKKSAIELIGETPIVEVSRYKKAVGAGDANIYAKEYKLYLPDKKLLQKKLKEWLDEEQN